MKFEILETQDTTHGKKHLIFFSSEDIKTYGYLWQEQLDILSKNKIPMETGIEERVNLYTKSSVIKNNLYFNTYWIEILKEKHSNGKSHVLAFKKYPILCVLLDDKTSVIHKKKTVSTSKNISSFRSFTLKSQNPNAIVNKLAPLQTMDDVMNLFYGEIKNKKTYAALKKNFLEKCLNTPYNSLDFDFVYMRSILFLKKRFSLEFMLEIFSTNKYEKLTKSPLYKNFWYSPISNELTQVQEGVLDFCFKKEGCTTEELAFNELLRFNVPSNHITFFSKMMGEPFEHFKPKIKDDALYFMNNISRSWGRLKNNNFNLPFLKREGFEWLKDVDGQTSQGYTFSVPKEYKDLVSWSEKMRNCLGNSNAEDTYTYLGLIGVYKKNELAWVLSVTSDSSISQFEGFKNSKPPKEEQKEVLEIMSKLSGKSIKMKKERLF